MMRLIVTAKKANGTQMQNDKNKKGKKDESFFAFRSFFSKCFRLILGC